MFDPCGNKSNTSPPDTKLLFGQISLIGFGCPWEAPTKKPAGHSRAHMAELKASSTRTLLLSYMYIYTLRLFNIAMV